MSERCFDCGAHVHVTGDSDIPKGARPTIFCDQCYCGKQTRRDIDDLEYVSPPSKPVICEGCNKRLTLQHYCVTPEQAVENDRVKIVAWLRKFADSYEPGYGSTGDSFIRSAADIIEKDDYVA